MFTRIIRKIKNILLARYSFFPASGDSVERINELRKSVARIDFTGETTSEWLQNQKTLRDLIMTRDPRDFINWTVIRYTMFYDADMNEYGMVKQSPRWKQLYAPCIYEDAIGNPPRSPYELSSSGNLIHHIYSLEQLYSTVPNFDFSHISSVVEFGGGYGSLCRMIYRLGFEGFYEIFDFKIFEELQKYFIRSTSISHYFDKMRFVDTPNDITSSPDLFVSLWSLSESPLVLRAEIIEKIGLPKYILIGYQPFFSGIDNVQYFKDMSKKMTLYTWVEKEIPHIDGNKYLIGIRQ